MRNFILANLFFISYISDVHAYEGTPESKKCFAFDVGYSGLWRSPLKNMDFLSQYQIVADKFQINSLIQKIPFSYVSGVRGMLEWMNGPKNSFEAVYTGLFNWRQSGSVTDPTELLFVSTAPYTNVNWTDFYYFDYHYKSELNSGELSYWRHVTPRYVDYFSFSWMLGLRYIDFRDSMHMKIGTGSVGDTGYVKLANQMGGGQGGFEFQANATSRFTWAIQVKGGAYANFMTRKSVLGDLGDTVKAVDFKTGRVYSAFSIELIPYIIYRLNPFYMKLSYDRVVLFNPGFAPLQMQPSKSMCEVYPHNYVNFQSVYASIGFYW